MGARSGACRAVRSRSARVQPNPAPGRRRLADLPRTLDGNRYSALDQINATNVRDLTRSGSTRLRDFNLESHAARDGRRDYVTGPNQVSALDARSGRELWRFSRPRTPGLQGDAARGLNRGVALLGRSGVFRDRRRAIAGVSVA